MTGDELPLLAKRVVTSKKLFNQREGWTAAEDTLPKRFLSEGLSVNGNETLLPRERLNAMIQAYYKARGWNSDGTLPSPLLGELALLDSSNERTFR